MVQAILHAHQTGRSFEPFDGVRIEPQTGYGGVVAVTAYRHWRAYSHRDRAQVGLFDIKVYVNGENMEHERSVILPTVALLTPTMAEMVFLGGDPRGVPANRRQRLVLATLQAAMAEQEVNWGNEPYQCKTYFAPPTRRTHDKRVVSTRPRDLLMGYIRRCFEIRGSRRWSNRVESKVKGLLSSCREQRASRSAALMPQMKGKYVQPAWEQFREDPSGVASPWLSGDVLDAYRTYAASQPANPQYRASTGRS